MYTGGESIGEILSELIFNSCAYALVYRLILLNCYEKYEWRNNFSPFIFFKIN